MKFNCPHCDKEYDIDGVHPGKKAKCKKCLNEFTIEQPIEDTPAETITTIFRDPKETTAQKGGRAISFILGVVITAGVCIPLSYAAGALLTRVDREVIESLRAERTELITSSKRLRNSSIKLQNAYKNVISKNELLRMKIKTLEESVDDNYAMYRNAVSNLSELKKNALTINTKSKEMSYECGIYKFSGIQILGYSDVTFKGIVENQGYSVKNSQFEVSFFDEDGIVLSVDTFYVSSFKPGQKRAFKEVFYDLSTSKIAGYKIDLASEY